ncbi:hypothetical protein [Xanthobacter flavus]|uniref:hypothetical protein n=1 Tax=Xanthobacter flavus TaxID=281 RepID=UPI003728E185
MGDPATLSVMALTGASAGFKAYGESQAQRYAAVIAERDAMVAKTQAAQTDTALREELRHLCAWGHGGLSLPTNALAIGLALPLGGVARTSHRL